MTDKKSQPVQTLIDLAVRMKEDGYPIAIIENAAYRMEQLEQSVIKQNNTIMGLDAYLTYLEDKCEDALGPAGSDVMAMIREDYDNAIPEGH